MTYEEFKKEIQGLEDKRVHRVTGSVGVYQAYKYIRKNKWFDIGRPLTEHEFYKIIRSINIKLAGLLSLGHDIKFPNKMGTLEVRKINTYVNIKDNKLHTNLPIDWDRTLKLWYEDEEAFKNKTLIKVEEKEIFKIFYNKYKANYNNKSYYQFHANRELKRVLKSNIKEGKIDAFLLNRNNYD